MTLTAFTLLVFASSSSQNICSIVDSGRVVIGIIALIAFLLLPLAGFVTLILFLVEQGIKEKKRKEKAQHHTKLAFIVTAALFIIGVVGIILVIAWLPIVLTIYGVTAPTACA